MSAFTGRRNYLRKAKSGPAVSVTVVLRLTLEERERLALQGRARGGFSPSAVARMVIERVIADDLFKAVLED